MESSVIFCVTAPEHRSHCWAALAPEKGGDPRSGEDRRRLSVAASIRNNDYSTYARGWGIHFLFFVTGP